MKTIEEFCTQHNACQEGRTWALENCKTMQEVWETALPNWVVWIATRKGVLTSRELAKFAIFCARSVERLLKDDRSKNAIDTAEIFIDGKATKEEILAAMKAARSACSACSAAYYSAYSAYSSEYSAAYSSAYSAACSAAYSAYSAACSAACSAERKKQAAWLRENTNPNFA